MTDGLLAGPCDDVIMELKLLRGENELLPGARYLKKGNRLVPSELTIEMLVKQKITWRKMSVLYQ
jgi:hypothetical protein